MYSIDISSNKDYYIILNEDGSQFVKVRKTANLADVMQYFNTNIIKGGENKCEKN